LAARATPGAVSALGRLQWWRDGGGRKRHRASCGCYVWRRVYAHPGCMQWCCRAEAERWLEHACIRRNYFDGFAGLYGWQWLFLAQGLPAIFLGFLVYFC
jgi:hypothetical protein